MFTACMRVKSYYYYCNHYFHKGGYPISQGWYGEPQNYKKKKNDTKLKIEKFKVIIINIKWNLRGYCWSIMVNIVTDSVPLRAILGVFPKPVWLVTPT